MGLLDDITSFIGETTQSIEGVQDALSGAGDQITEAVESTTTEITSPIDDLINFGG